jgi:hypothetical protein
MLSLVLDKPHNLDVLCRCLSMIAAYRPSSETEVIVPWDGKPREILPILKAFSSRFYWKIGLCPEGAAGYLAVAHLAKAEQPVFLSHRLLMTGETLVNLESTTPGRASVYKTDGMLMEYDPYSYWFPDGYRQNCLKMPHQVKEVQVDNLPYCVAGTKDLLNKVADLPFVDAQVFLMDGPPVSLGKFSGEAIPCLSSTDTPCFPPDEDRV